MSHLGTFFFTVISCINTVFICFTLFFERKAPTRRMAWLLTLFFLPVIGMFLYILLSGHFFTKTRKMDTARKTVRDVFSPFIAEQKKYFLANASTVPNEEVQKYARLIDMNLSVGGSLVTFSDSCAIFCWGQHMFDSLCNDMEHARQSIHMQFFIFRNDSTGRKIRDILCRKAQEGVAVKVLYDDVGSIMTPQSFFKPIAAAGGEVLPFFSVRNGSPFSLNFRNHRKITVIDNETGYMGGVNVGDEYANCSSKRHPVLWRDTHIRLTGTSVLSMQLIFLMDWYSIASGNKMINTLEEAGKYFPLAHFENLGRTITADYMHQQITDSFNKKSIPTQIISSSPNSDAKSEIRDTLIRMIMSAKKNIYIQTPYFTPDETFFSILKIAAYSGIDIKIMVPGKWDKWYVRAAAMGYIRDLIDTGVRFFSYNGFIHSKTAVVDGHIASIGSANIDTRSFDMLFEITAVFYDSNIAETCEQIFNEDIKNCTEMKKEDFGRRFSVRRAWWGFCRLFSSLM